MSSEASATHLIILASANLHREAWRALLSIQPYIHLVETACDVSVVAALPMAEEATSVLVDVPGDELATAKQLNSSLPGIGLLFLVDDYDLDFIVSLLQAGAKGCIARSASIAELARAVIAVGRGEIALPPEVAGRALAALARGQSVQGDLIEELTERETEVLQLLAQGMTNKDMAQTLILSVRTVEAHLRSIYGKLGVHSRTEAALWAVRNGFGPED